jgi:beta-fructofuranosidase
MSLRLPDRWLWDFWLVERGSDIHVFYLQAPRSLQDPHLRHANASIGHAVSRDLRAWRVLPDALGPGPAGRFDDLATWTGSVLQHAGRWLLFYTGVSRVEAGRVQRIGMATSVDLVAWDRTDVVIRADPAWYELGSDTAEEHWRDPWAFVGPDGFVHLLVTARSGEGSLDGRGVIGHAWSSDLANWHVGPPLSAPGWFRQLEVPQLFEMWDRWYVLASAGPQDHAAARRERAGFVEEGGSLLLDGDSPFGPFRPVPGRMLVGDARSSLYAGRVIHRPEGWRFLAWRHLDADGRFVGELSDPMTFGVGPDGRPVVAAT